MSSFVAVAVAMVMSWSQATAPSCCEVDLVTVSYVAMARCTGADGCKACTTCESCAHCQQEGQTCGVCRKPPATQPSTQPSTRPATRPSTRPAP